MGSPAKLYNSKSESFLRKIKGNSLIEIHRNSSHRVKKYIKEFWTSKQRKGNSIHEISYRACFKSELPKYFIESLTNSGDVVYDCFMGRGTSLIESALLGRNIIGNDINPLSKILTVPRLFIPEISEVEARLKAIPINNRLKSKKDFSMFFHKQTFQEILSIRFYILEKQKENKLDDIDMWIRMVATNRLTGHSKNFFSGYTLPPNQAISAERQAGINHQRNLTPPYKDTKEIIIKKTRTLIKNIDNSKKIELRNVGLNGVFYENDARKTYEIPNNHVTLTITSPPFLNIIHYGNDNWLRCWFNGIDATEIEHKITMTSKLSSWVSFMTDVLKELYRVTKPSGYVAVEVGEIRNGKILLDEIVDEIGYKIGFISEGICINKQMFTKTSQIWGVTNNSKGTNTNRIVLLRKP